MAKLGRTNEELFLDWLRNKLPQKQVSECYMCCLEIEPLLKKKHWIRSSFFEINSPQVITQTVKLIDEGKHYSSTKKEVFRKIKSSLMLYLQFLADKSKEHPQGSHNDTVSPSKGNDRNESQNSSAEHKNGSSARHTAEWIVNEKNAFMEWLRANGQIESNVMLYAQAVEKATQLAKQAHCRHVEFYNVDLAETERSLSEIRADAKFEALNRSKSFIYTRAIKKYIAFQQQREHQASDDEKIHRISWTKHEAVVLLDACIEIISNESRRTEIIQRVSNELRQMARNNGLEIDDVYRNINGIQFQMKSMESAFWGKTIVKPSTALFREVTELYKENRAGYETLLTEAKNMISGNTEAFASSGSFCADNQISLESSSNRITVSPDDSASTEATVHPSESRWESILREFFPDGYILDDFISQFQASGNWMEKYDEPCPLEGAAIDAAIRKCGSLRDGRVYPVNKQEGELLDIINSEIQSILASYSAVYAEKIYEKYQNQLTEISIYSQDVMASQLLKLSAGNYRIVDSHVFAKPYSGTQVTQDCEQVLRGHGGSLGIAEIASTLWFLPFDTVYQALNRDKNILFAGSGEWMLIEHFPMTPENAWIIGNSIEEAFLTRDFLVAEDLIALIKAKQPSIFEDISGLPLAAQFNILAYYLSKRFTFSTSVVAPLGTAIGKNTLFAAFAKDHSTFSMAELDAFASELKTPVYWDALFDSGVLRIQKDQFIRIDQIMFDVASVDEVLDSICDGDYIAFANIPGGMFALLPSCGTQWNEYLLFSYVRNVSQAFFACYNSIGKTGCYGAMVRRKSAITNYDQLIEQVLIDTDSWITDQDALSLIVRDGYQATKKLKGIGDIVQRARKKKRMMGDESHA